MKINTFTLRAFGATDKSGNPAGVILNADALTDKQKLSIAAYLGYSETAFIQKSNKADFRLTYFTPTQEVEICMHATIAAFTLLQQKGLVRPQTYTIEIIAGILKVKIIPDGIIFIDQLFPVFSEKISEDVLAESLQIEPSTITSTGLSPQIVSTGSRNILIPIKNRPLLFSIKPDKEKLIALNKKTKTNGFKLFTLDTISSTATAHSRDIAPIIGIDEEAATGITTGSLACYLYNYKKLHGKDLNHLVFEQGYSMDNPSHIIAKLETNNEQITRIQIGGKAILIEEKTV